MTACVSSKKAEREEGTTRETSRGHEQGQNLLNEDFDPMTLKAPEFYIPRKQMIRTEIPARDTLEAKIVTPAVADTSWQTVFGYQVQLLQTEDAQLARETVKEAILALDTEVDIIYDEPYFKVRAGGFVSRYDAEQLQNLATEKGYANCWVVRTQVKVRASELRNQK
jgi:hypothetical protein